MSNTLAVQQFSRGHRILLAGIFVAFLLSLFSLAVPNAAFACSGAMICGGTGTGGSTPPPGSPTGSPQQQIVKDKGGVLAPSKPAAPVVQRPLGLDQASLYRSWTQTGSIAPCAIRDDGKAAIKAINTYGTYILESVGGQSPGAGWISAGSAPNGTYYWEKTTLISVACKYPPRVYYSTIMCSISQTVQANQVAPSRKVLATRTTGTGYAENAGSLNSCYGAYGNVFLNQPITEYGYYDIYTWQRMQAVRVEIAYTPNEVTGVLPAPKIVSRSAAYNTSPFLAQTASLDCQNGFLTPGKSRTDWTETPCNKIANPTYTCAPQPIQFDVADGTAVSMRATGNGFIQLMRDGKARKAVFDQRPSGATVTVNAGRYKTTFHRAADSTPWKSSALFNKNLFDLSATATGTSILSQENGTKSPTYSGKKNDVWFTAIDASDASKPTKVTQQLNWAGTRTIRSGTIISINANTGAISWAPRTVTVPTSGVCNQTASVEYVRSIGDVVR